MSFVCLLGQSTASVSPPGKKRSTDSCFLSVPTNTDISLLQFSPRTMAILTTQISHLPLQMILLHRLCVMILICSVEFIRLKALMILQHDMYIPRNPKVAMSVLHVESVDIHSVLHENSTQ